MLDISCLVKNTTLRNDLNDLVEFIAYSRVAKNLDAGLQSIYNDIRSNGIEVDLQTVGFIYNDVLPKSYAQFDSDHDVNEYALKSFNDAINRAARLEAPEQTERQIGQNSPDIEVVNGILNMFTKLNTEQSDPIYSDMRAMQEALWKGIQRKLNLTNQSVPKTQQDWESLLSKAIGYEQLGMTDINGRLNGIADLFDSMKEQLKNSTDEMEGRGDYATAQKWRDMTAKLKAASYSLLFSKGEAKTFITSIMKEAGYSKVLKNGKTVIDWNKLSNDTGSALDLFNNIDRVMTDKGYSKSVIDGVQDSFVNEVNDMNAKIMKWRLKQLDNKSEVLGRAANKKTDLKRLAELNNLGIFQSAHDKLLSSVVGISDLQAEDLQDLENLAKAASDLYREIDKSYGDGIFAASALQSIQRSIDRIVQRNINNKTRLMKIMSAIKNFVDVLLTGMLMGPLTIFENWLSGIKETMAPFGIGKSKFTNAEDRQVYRSVLADVFTRGQSYGEEVGSFAPRELYSNSLRFKWDGDYKSKQGLKAKAESALYVLMAPARLGLLGFDSANKVVITNKTFNNAMYQALLQHGKTAQEAEHLLNEALHGQKYQDAKNTAEDILNNVNSKLGAKFSIPVNDNTITRLANDLVKANLNTDGLVTDKAKATEIVVSTLKGSYHVAGYGLGHEPNNPLSRMIKNSRDSMVRKEQKIRTEKNWNKLAWHKLGTTFLNGFILRFTGGATNWIVLRAQSGLGLGIASGFLGKWMHGPDFSGELDFKNEDTIQKSVRERLGARNQIGRGMAGLTYTLAGYVAYYLLTQGGDDDRERKRKRLAELTKFVQTPQVKDEIKKLTSEENVMKQIKSSYMGNRLFKKTAPDVMLLQYYLQTDKNALMGVIDYVTKTSGIGSDFSTASKFNDAIRYSMNGEESMAKGKLASIAGDQMAVPLWRAYKDWFKLGAWISSPLTGYNVSSDFKQPSNVSEGFFGGGALEDWGVYHRNSSITILPGIGAKGIERFKAVGIKNMGDLEKHPGWENTMYINEKGKPEFILDAGDRKNAKAAAEKWIKEN